MRKEILTCSNSALPNSSIWSAVFLLTYYCHYWILIANCLLLHVNLTFGNDPSMYLGFNFTYLSWALVTNTILFRGKGWGVLCNKKQYFHVSMMYEKYDHLMSFLGERAIFYLVPSTATLILQNINSWSCFMQLFHYFRSKLLCYVILTKYNL